MRVSEDATIGDLGAPEYWIMDEEGGSEPLIKSKCQPMMLAPGYRVQVPTPVNNRGRIPKRPGFLSGMGCGCPVTSLLGFGDYGMSGFFEVLAPTGMQVAAFRCRPFFVDGELAVKDVRGGRETLVQRGAAEFPEGTMRSRHQALRTFRR